MKTPTVLYILGCVLIGAGGAFYAEGVRGPDIVGWILGSALIGEGWVMQITDALKKKP